MAYIIFHSSQLSQYLTNSEVCDKIILKLPIPINITGKGDGAKEAHIPPLTTVAVLLQTLLYQLYCCQLSPAVLQRCGIGEDHLNKLVHVYFLLHSM